MTKSPLSDPPLSHQAKARQFRRGSSMKRMMDVQPDEPDEMVDRHESVVVEEAREQLDKSVSPLMLNA